jgi:inosine-uridine nucleoside N-ribohydrolase
MHDPLAVVSFLDRSVLKTQDMYVDIETSGELTAGETVAYRNAPIRRSPPSMAEPAGWFVLSDTFKPNTHVAVDVDVDKFFKIFVGRLVSP